MRPHRGPGRFFGNFSRIFRALGIIILAMLWGDARAVDSHAFASSGAGPLPHFRAASMKIELAFSLGDAVYGRVFSGPIASKAGRRATWARRVGQANECHVEAGSPGVASAGLARSVGLNRTLQVATTAMGGGPSAGCVGRVAQLAKRRGGSWGRLLAAWMAATVVNQRRRDQKLRVNKGSEERPSGYIALKRGTCDTKLPTLRAGGVSRCNAEKRDLFAKNQAELIPVALMDWGRWYGAEAVKLANQAVEKNIGGSVADSTRHNYEGHFRKWAIFRGVNKMDPYLGTNDDSVVEDEDSVLSYVALSVGPLGKEVSTMVTHLSAIGFFHRIKFGVNPLAKMARVQLMLKGLKRAGGPVNRKLPITVEDLRSLKGLLNLREADQLCLWVSILTGWFFMLRMSEFLVTNSKHTPPGRHPIYMEDVQPLCNGSPTHWGNHVDEISIHISGSKTDWLNQGCVRSHTRVSSDSPNADICVVQAYVDLFNEHPVKFTKYTDRPVASWRNGDSIPQEAVTALLRAAASANGNSPAAYSLHSLRSGGHQQCIRPPMILTWSPGSGDGARNAFRSIYGKVISFTRDYVRRWLEGVSCSTRLQKAWEGGGFAQTALREVSDRFSPPRGMRAED